MQNELLKNMDKVHSTEMGYDRIRKNLCLDLNNNALLDWCKSKILSAAKIERRGKNWYVHFENAIVTVNAHSYTIITAHKQKEGVA